MAAILLIAALVVVPRLGSTLVVSEPIAEPDGIVSLASHEWERLPCAARMARAHPDAAVLLTVPEEVTPYNCHDCDNRVSRLERLGVDGTRVQQVVLSGPGTYGEARAVLGLARERGVRRLLVVTSPYHTRRALATFRTVFEGSGVEIGIVPAEVTPPAKPSRWLLAGYDRAYVAYEWAAIGYYAWKYGVLWEGVRS